MDRGQCQATCLKATIPLYKGPIVDLKKMDSVPLAQEKPTAILLTGC